MSSTAQFERFRLRLSRTDWVDCSAPGRNADGYVARVVEKNYVQAQLDAIGLVAVRDELRDYGAWSKEELDDVAANRARIVWIAAGNIRDK